jgi:BirA family biotin operon repressor/biotin-[acetyl-CoA-carboxylase] ligase
MLGRDRIMRQLHTKWAACNIVYKDVTGSTNSDAADLSLQGTENGTLVVADRQDSGRGSRGRSWETPAGSNIAMSLILRPTAPHDRISMMTLVMGLSIAEGIDLALSESGYGENPCRIKWPNDVVIDGRKICGILTELHMYPDGNIRDVVIGVGINVNMTVFPKEIEDIAGSLLTQTGVRTDRSLVVARCMERFEDNYNRYRENYDLSLLKEQYEAKLINANEKVRVLDPKGEYEGVALGIDNLGELIVEVSEDDGTKRVDKINAGEVSVRGLYGYV